MKVKPEKAYHCYDSICLTKRLRRLCVTAKAAFLNLQKLRWSLSFDAVHIYKRNTTKNKGRRKSPRAELRSILVLVMQRHRGIQLTL